MSDSPDNAAGAAQAAPADAQDGSVEPGPVERAVQALAADADGTFVAQYLSLEDILAADDRPVEDIYVPEWGGWLRIQGLMASRMDDLRKASTVAGEVDESLLMRAMLAECILEPALTLDNVGALLTKSMAAVAPIMTKIGVLNGGGGTPTAVSAAKATFPPAA